ncbi:heterokaryon incompatibility protein-domain-containing protein [Podospora didyma]|uniref:Heterokaryon incompatibility protein-domain-containing protein n=1 Tax=Podospora didyma TaxID=330526 RepID=A0AAE0KIY4_9PEZI|nr:heterokaryon incompatibility protein-domain-containing protein [Podospora didyma]
MEGEAETTNTSLCDVCLTISLDEMRGPNCDRMQPHQPSYWALKQSVKQGCRLCGFIWTALGQSKSSSDGEPGTLVLEHVSERYPGREISLVGWGGGCPDSYLDRLQVITSGEIPDISDSEESVDGHGDPTMHPAHGFALSGVLDIFADADDPAAWHGGVTGRSLPMSDGSSETDFAFVSCCLDDCLSNHVSCHANQNPYLPSRVLDLGPFDRSHTPYLLETSGEMRARYATLSHCWGGNVSLTTTTSNLPAHKHAVPMPSMPPTFQNAVQITRQLGLQYLWIDSLCILQDSREDWETESLKMGIIYRDSFITIAARAARNSQGGCFIPRVQKVPSCQITYRSPSLRNPKTGEIFIRDPAFPLERIRDTPLDQRGWVLQEKMLSPRIIYYGAQQLYWECRERSVRQDGKYYDMQREPLRYTHFKQGLDLYAPYRSAFGGFHGPVKPDLDEKRLELAVRMGQWYRLVEEYSRRKLTFGSDKLPAIAGIAKEFARTTGRGYIAGLWREDVRIGILWRREGDLRENDCTGISQKLPSWSWARFDGEVSFWVRSGGLLMVPDESCTVVDISCRTTDSLGIYGDVSEAKIQLRGHVAPVFCTTLADPNSGLKRFGEMILDDPRLGLDLLDVELFCLLVYAGAHGSRPMGLALRRVGDALTFLRVGYVLDSHQY